MVVELRWVELPIPCARSDSVDICDQPRLFLERKPLRPVDGRIIFWQLVRRWQFDGGDEAIINEVILYIVGGGMEERKGIAVPCICLLECLTPIHIRVVPRNIRAAW